MLFMNVEAAHEHTADLRRAADRDRRSRAPRVVHQFRALDLERARPRRSGRWGAVVARLAR